MDHNFRKHGREGRPQKWTAAVDWFRWRTNDFDDIRPVIHAAQAIQDEDISRASFLKPWRFQGYEGWHTESIRWGQRGGRVIWESSGEKAACTWGRMPLSSGKALRIDLQTTLSLSTPQPTFGSSLLRSITQTSRSRRRTPILLGLHTESSGLWLGTVGRRTSPSYLRIYDKGVESRLAAPGVLWRVEVELKSQNAEQLCRTSLERLSEPVFCASYCEQSLTSRGCSWPFAPLTEESLDVSTGRKEQATPARLAQWISLSVRPVIQRLLTVYSADELRTMLGLSDVGD